MCILFTSENLSALRFKELISIFETLPRAHKTPHMSLSESSYDEQLLYFEENWPFYNDT